MATPGTSVDWIIQHSRRYPLLTPAEEITLARQVQAWVALGELEKPTKQQKAIINKGRRARDRFFLSNIRLAVNVAGKYKKFSGTLTLEDLIQEGLIGLDSAILKFEPALGYKFSTYSYWWIRQGITRAINKYSRVIHLPTAANDSIRKASDYMRDYCREHGKLPPVAEVAAFCKVGKQTLLAYLNHNAGIISLDQALPNSKDLTTWMDVVADPSENELVTNEMQVLTEQLRVAVSSLPDQHQHIVKERYFTGEKRPTTYSVLGQELHMSRETVRQIHDHALSSLRFKLGGLTAQECIQALQSAA